MYQKLQFFLRPQHHLKVLEESSCLRIGKHRGPLGSQNFSCFYYIAILLLAVAYKILVIAARIDVTRTRYK